MRHEKEVNSKGRMQSSGRKKSVESQGARVYKTRRPFSEGVENGPTETLGEQRERAHYL